MSESNPVRIEPDWDAALARIMAVPVTDRVPVLVDYATEFPGLAVRLARVALGTNDEVEAFARRCFGKMDASSMRDWVVLVIARLGPSTVEDFAVRVSGGDRRRLGFVSYWLANPLVDDLRRGKGPHF